ncbi:hypothetical protein [Rhodococcus opacus]|uniref:hypothetical protein n=1 Tax=Rhodococcus opacus TaxID=37919 RepID=UPI001F5A8448|nr:hypothetical protein [Rhodococcus opacus]UNN05188.1 hypothetical protein MOO23_40465 [Rhodococcus opacus]
MSGADTSELVIDHSVTSQSPKTVELNGLEVSFYYMITDRSGGQHGPLVALEMTTTDGSGSKNFRANVEVKQGGQPVDAYFYPLDGDETVYSPEAAGVNNTKNELAVSNIHDKLIAGVMPYSDPRAIAFEMTSTTGTDFEITLTDLQVSETPFTTKASVTEPQSTFDTTPAGQFNKLASERGWQAPKSFTPASGGPGFEPDPTRRPAAAMLSFIRQVNEWGTSGSATTSSTQIFSEWMKDWNPEMLSTGIAMLGDDQIKETLRRVQAGDIEHWFGNSTHVVGIGPNQIPPGTYQVVAPPGKLITDGYWERTSKSGDIIENNFVSSAQQVTVTIEASDGQFTSKKMGTWKPMK